MPKISLPAEFVVLDFETTGLEPAQANVIEIGAIKCTADGKEIARLNLLISGFTVPEEIEELTGITQAMTDAGEPPAQAWAKLIEFIGSLPIYAHYAVFEQKFARYHAKRYAGGLELKNRFICTRDMAREAWPGLPSYKLGELCKHLGIKFNAHRAMPDALATLQLLGAMATGRAITSGAFAHPKVTVKHHKATPAVKKPTSAFTKIAAGVFALIFISQCSKLINPKPEPTTPTPAQTPGPSDADKKLFAAQDAAAALKKSAKNPASLKFTAATLLPDGTTCMSYTAQNSYGATSQELAVFVPGTGMTTGKAGAEKHKKLCKVGQGKSITATLNAAI